MTKIESGHFFFIFYFSLCKQQHIYVNYIPISFFLGLIINPSYTTVDSVQTFQTSMSQIQSTNFVI